MPVFSRPHSKPNDLSDSASSRDGGSPARPAGTLLGADVNQAVQERAGRDDQRAHAYASPSSMREADDAPVLDENPPGLADQPLDVRLGVERRPAPSAVDCVLSACARGDQTAGPRLRLSSLN